MSIQLDHQALAIAQDTFFKGGPPGVLRIVQHIDSYPGERVSQDDPPDPEAYQTIPTTMAQGNDAIEQTIKAYLEASS